MKGEDEWAGTQKSMR